MNTYLDNLRQKKSALDDILRLTQTVGFTGEEDDALKYITMVENREKCFTRLRELDAALLSGRPSDQLITEEKLLNDQIEALALSIIEADNLLKERCTSIMSQLKSGLKQINQGRNVNNVYTPQVGLSGGLYFDQTN